VQNIRARVILCVERKIDIPVAVDVENRAVEARKDLEEFVGNFPPDVSAEHNRVEAVFFLRAHLAHAGQIVVDVGEGEQPQSVFSAFTSRAIDVTEAAPRIEPAPGESAPSRSSALKVDRSSWVVHAAAQKPLVLPAIGEGDPGLTDGAQEPLQR
jgi:hypothetical protein